MADFTFLVADALNLPNSTSPQWGIFLAGIPVVVADTVVDHAFKAEWALSDYPIEEGGFETFNKVFVPKDARFRFAAGGSEANRQALLESIDAIAGDTNLYDIVTPTKVYESFNITHYDFRRTSINGLGLLQVDVWCLEVSIGATVLSSTKDPTSATQNNDGTVQSFGPSTGSSGPRADSAQTFGPSTGSSGPRADSAQGATFNSTQLS